MLELTIPGTPPSGNHYVKHTRTGRHYVTKEAKRFKETVGYIAAGKSVEGKRFKLRAVVYLGKGQRGDADNFSKCLQDSLADAGVFNGKSDASVKDSQIVVGRDWANPRTVVTIEAIS